MHEMSIATSLIEKVLEAARANHVARVDKVELEVGALQLIVPEALDLAFTALSQGTIASEAVLKQTEVPAEARCRGCGRTYAVTVDQYQCPQCGRADVEIIAGHDIILKSMSGVPEGEFGGST